MGLAEVALAVIAATATLVPLVLGVQGYLRNEPKVLADSTSSMALLPPTTAELGPHLALEITTPAQPGADEISKASKAAQRRIDRMDRDDWDRRYRALLPPVEPPQPGNGCTCEWVDDTTLGGTTHYTHAGYATDCPNHQPPERLP